MAHTYTLCNSATALGNVSVMVVHAILYQENGKDEASFIQVETLRKDPRFQVYADQIQARGAGLDGPLAPVAYERIFEGSTVSSCYLLSDLYGNRGAFFVFEDLSVKMDGVYRIQFVLSELQEYGFFAFVLHMAVWMEAHSKHTQWVETRRDPSLF